MIVRPTLGSLPNSRSFRGQPLAIMLAVVAIWFGLRASLLAPVAEPGKPELLARPARGAEAMARADTTVRDGSPAPWRTGPTDLPAPPFMRLGAAAAAVPLRAWVATPALGPPNREQSDSGADMPPAFGAAEPELALQSHGPALGPATLQRVGFSLALPAARSSGRKRLSIDGWLFLREGSAGEAGAAPLAPTYGASQFGAVLRYDLGSRTHPPQAYLRATGAIDSRETDLAAGIRIRPVAALPLRAHGEVRVSRLGDRVELRPSAFVTLGVERALPLDARVRGYAQAGYVGGKFATGFADGSLVVERGAKRFERGALAVGGGAWGGAQKGTERLDVGPTASMALRLGQGSVRLAADYRFRVAGDAEPSSGAALTLSTSF